MSHSSLIPTSTSVVESAVIKAPLSQAWHYIKLQVHLRTQRVPTTGVNSQLTQYL